MTEKDRIDHLADELQKATAELQQRVRRNAWRTDPVENVRLDNKYSDLKKILSELKDRTRLETSPAPGLTLATLRDKLSQLNPESKVTFEDGTSPANHFNSYRGIYWHAALSSQNYQPCNALQLINAINIALRVPLSGYKGGEFTTYPQTPVWHAHPAEATGIAIVDAVQKEDRIILVTRPVTDL